MGDDEAEKASLAAEFAGLVEEDLRAFNVERLYGGEIKPVDILDAARTLPLMARRRIVIVVQAEKVLFPRRETTESLRALEGFDEYVREPAPHATLVLVFGELDKRFKRSTLLSKRGTKVECGGLHGAAAQRWACAQAEQAGLQMEGRAAALLATRAGRDTARLRADVARVLLFARGTGRVTVEDVEQVIGPATSQDDWAMTNAIARGAAPEALRELALMLDGGGVPVKILGQLGWLVRTRLPAARARPAMEAVFRTDLDLKSSAGDPRVLLERLVVELCDLRGG